MMKRVRWISLALVLPFLAACSLFAGGLGGTPTAVPASPEPSTPVPPSPTVPPSPEPTEPPPSAAQFIAYVRDGQLLVTDVTGGVQGGTTQYTMPGQGDQVMDLAWSPSGEFLAYTAPVHGNAHIFYIYAVGASTPTDLGPGNSPSWSPDSRSLAYLSANYPDDNIWITSIENPAPRQLTFESNHAWGGPVFTPDGSALIVSTADRFNMGAQGNTSFTLERLPLDGSGTHTPLPGATELNGVRLPFDLHFSPDATRLAFSSSYHLSACASPGYYYVAQADGSNMQQFQSPSLVPALTEPERYYVGLDYAWAASGDALLANGIVTDCDFNSPTMGQVVGGPQMSILRLDGTETLVIPGMFHSLSVDRTGTLAAAAHYKDIEDLHPVVELYSLQTGQVILSLGPGYSPQFQP